MSKYLCIWAGCKKHRAIGKYCRGHHRALIKTGGNFYGAILFSKEDMELFRQIAGEARAKGKRIYAFTIEQPEK
jgi:hypothetical protein